MEASYARSVLPRGPAVLRPRGLVALDAGCEAVALGSYIIAWQSVILLEWGEVLLAQFEKLNRDLAEGAKVWEGVRR